MVAAAVRTAQLSSLLVLAALALVPAGAAAQNPWLERRVLNIAHQGGEDEFPSNTLYAFRQRSVPAPTCSSSTSASRATARSS